MPASLYSPLQRHRAERLGETLVQVAKRGKVSIGTLSNVERGARVSPRLFPRIAKGYRLSLNRLRVLLSQDGGK